MVQLYPHQIQGLKEAKNHNHVAFYWDMGLGKTYAGSEKIMQLGAKINLVVCQKSKISDWVEHFLTNYPDFDVYDLTNPKSMDVFWQDVEITYQQPVIVGVINYDLVWRRPELLNLSDFTLLLDESSLIQTDTAKRTKFILKMEPKNVILLSGTPTGGKYEKLWTQMHLLGWNISKQLYWNQFVKVDYLDTMKGSIPIVVGYQNVDRLKRKMHQYGCQFLMTDEVFDLPEQVFQKIRVQASEDYIRFRKDCIVEIDGETLVGDTTLTKMLYERMLCGQYNEAKLEAFADLLDSTDDRMVVFYNFNEELDRLIHIANEHNRPFGVVSGWHKNPEVLSTEGALLFVQYQAGAMGLNLQKANRMVFYSLPLSSELFEQAKKRIHRIGQNRTCFYYIMLCKGSIEDRILAALEMRKDYTEELFRKEDTL